MDNSDEDQHLEHQKKPPQSVSMEELESIGVIYWKVDNLFILKTFPLFWLLGIVSLFWLICWSFQFKSLILSDLFNYDIKIIVVEVRTFIYFIDFD